MKLIEALKSRLVGWVWNHTLNCAEMARLSSRAFEEPLSVRMRIKMRLHHLICAWCRRYDRQLKFLHGAAPKLESMSDPVSPRGLSDEARRRLIERLRDESRP